MRRCRALLSFLLLMGACLSGQTSHESETARTISAHRLTVPVRVDGVLDEAVWLNEAVTGFVQSKPDDGFPASERSEVWVGYDDDALYIAARLHDRNPELIDRRLGRRDDGFDSDWFIVSLDPYRDGRSGYSFAVNPAGCIRDAVLYDDEKSDSTWDGVWKTATQVNDHGWTVEMRIPFHQLRFRSGEVQTWGVFFQRQIRRKNEIAGLTWIPRTESGFVSRFSRLEGLSGIHAGANLELIPYSVGKAAFSTAEEGNPFGEGSRYSGNAGLDARIALMSNLTLNLTVNPDFGQVEVDPAKINLTAAENYYFEKRPFFVENANIFRFGVSGSNRFVRGNWPEPTFFYSRRIGRSPQYSPQARYMSSPEATTILAAAKITGKVGGNWNLGMVHAVTQREHASLVTPFGEESATVEPFTYYGVLRLVRELDEGRHGLGIIGSAALRDLDEPHLNAILMRRALMLGVDGWTFLDRERVWSLSAWWGGTTVSGSREALTALQYGYPHYFQRPDADHLEVNPQADFLSGWSGRVMLNKQKGNFIFNVAVGAISPGFEIRDLGYQSHNDLINSHVMAGYRSFTAGKVLRSWSVEFMTQRNYNFDGVKIADQVVGVDAALEFLNYWQLHLNAAVNAGYTDPTRTRGGVSMWQPGNSAFSFWLESDDRKALVFEAGFGLRRGRDHSTHNEVSAALEWKPGPGISLQLVPGYAKTRQSAQWIRNVEDSSMTATSGTRHIFGHLEQHTISSEIRVNWIFTPRLSLQAYVQPFISVGDYSEIKELAAPRSFSFSVYGEGESTIVEEDGRYIVDPDGAAPGRPFLLSNPDFNYKSLRGTVVLRWEYRPGSVLYLVWTQNQVDYANPGDLRLGRDLGDLFRARGDNIIMMKVTYRFNI
ncbi:MAG TPA: hypothetical protein ENN40_10450 [Candidatus Aminicenantes bacterium]|nr:hypothetical protein [Candidatus Aminicenantes bacterium]